jgi:hypothetical protein
VSEISGEVQFPSELASTEQKLSKTNAFFFDTPDVKLYCTKCGRLEAFNAVSTEEFLRRGAGSRDNFSTNQGIVQVFVMSFLCQSCKGVPEVFTIRREGAKLVLCGRAPIEHIEVPTVIPKQVRPLFSGAIVAHQSGQTLAGIFLLRTLIEQWAQSAAPSKGIQADEAIDSYLTTLPEDFKGRFPSLRALYGELSADIHCATGSSELFEKARNQILEHFDARRLYKLG